MPYIHMLCLLYIRVYQTHFLAFLKIKYMYQAEQSGILRIVLITLQCWYFQNRNQDSCEEKLDWLCLLYMRRLYVLQMGLQPSLVAMINATHYSYRSIVHTFRYCNTHISIQSRMCRMAMGNDYPFRYPVPDTKVHGVNMGPTWVLSAPDEPHVSPMSLVIRGVIGSSRRVVNVGWSWQNIVVVDWCTD